MKLITLLALAALISAADYVELTLKDGRKLSGLYDIETGVLDMGVGKIVIKREEIKEEFITTAPVKEAKKSKKPDDVVSEFQQKLAAIEEQRRSTISEFRKSIQPIIMTMDLRLVDVGNRYNESTQNTRELNSRIEQLREYVAQIMIDDFRRTTSQEYQKIYRQRGSRYEESDDNFISCISILTDPLLFAAYSASRSQPLIPFDPSSCVAEEKKNYADWRADKRRQSEADMESRRKQTQPERSSGSGGTVILGQPKQVGR